MEAKEKAPLVELVGKGQRPLVLNDLEKNSFPRTKAEEAQFTAAKKEWDQAIFEKQLEATILKVKQMEQAHKNAVSQGGPKPVTEASGERPTDTNQPTATVQTNVLNQLPKMLVKDFGSVVVPQDLLDFQIREIIMTTLQQVDPQYRLGKIDLTQFKAAEKQAQFKQVFEFSSAQTKAQMGTLQFIRQTMPVILGQGFEINGGMHLDEVDWLSYVDAYDHQDGNLTSQVKCDYQAVNSNKAGIYPVHYQVTNSHQQTQQMTVWIRVKIMKPQLVAHDLVLTATRQIDQALLIAQVQANDALEGDLLAQVQVDDRAVNYQMVGQYPITYQVQNSFGLVATTTKQLTIEAQQPILTAKNITLTMTKQAVQVDWLAHVTAEDPLEDNLLAQVTVNDEAVDLQKSGQYPIYYQVTNQNGGSATASAMVSVVVPTPIIEVTPFGIRQGTDLEQFAWQEHVTAQDEDGTDLTNYVTIFHGEVNVEQPGQYPVYYMVRNAYQKQATKQVMIEVK